jgi:hypothetical protein
MSPRAATVVAAIVAAVVVLWCECSIAVSLLYLVLLVAAEL